MVLSIEVVVLGSGRSGTCSLEERETAVFFCRGARRKSCARNQTGFSSVDGAQGKLAKRLLGEGDILATWSAARGANSDSANVGGALLMGNADRRPGCFLSPREMP